MNADHTGISLRPLTLEDLPHVRGGDSPFDDFGGRPERTEPHGADLLSSGGLAITDANDRVLGLVSWHWVHWGPNPESTNPMIGVWLASDARRRGVGTQAQRALVDRLFSETGVHRIEAHTDVENIAEQRALEKAGFVREGTTRGAQWRQGAFHDCHLYSILKNEWSAEA